MHETVRNCIFQCNLLGGSKQHLCLVLLHPQAKRNGYHFLTRIPGQVDCIVRVSDAQMLSGTDTLIDTQSRGLQCHHRPYGQISHLQLPATATTPVQTTAKMCNCTRACCSKHTVLFRNMKVACQNKSHLSSCSKSVAYQVLSRS